VVIAIGGRVHAGETAQKLEGRRGFVSTIALRARINWWLSMGLSRLRVSDEVTPRHPHTSLPIARWSKSQASPSQGNVADRDEVDVLATMTVDAEEVHIVSVVLSEERPTLWVRKHTAPFRTEPALH
jgi:hypothetical protein